MGDTSHDIQVEQGSLQGGGGEESTRKGKGQGRSHRDKSITMKCNGFKLINSVWKEN